MKAVLNFKGKKIEISEIKKVKGLKKFWGLMFSRREKADALLFEFKKPTRTSIHSLFCPSFLALWIKDRKIIEHRLIEKWELSIKPKTAFDMLVEIPLNKRYNSVVKLFSSGNFTTRSKAKGLNSISS